MIWPHWGLRPRSMGKAADCLYEKAKTGDETYPIEMLGLLVQPLPSLHECAIETLSLA
jgi:hypothetical protein